MPIEKVPGTSLSYHLIAFDAEGRERVEGEIDVASRRALAVLGVEPITDVFLFSHGWQGDIPAARRQYNAWIAAMAGCIADIERVRQARSGVFRPLLIGLHWPSLPWGDEELAGPAVSFGPIEAPPVEALVEEYAGRISDTPEARGALQVIFEAAMDDVAPIRMPPEVRAAYEALDHESAMGSAGEGAAPGDDREPFDPERVYREAEDAAVSFGGLDAGGLLAPLRTLSFWKMKDRARRFGESGGASLLAKLQRAAGSDRGVRFHLMGHSFGCIVVSAMLSGQDGRGLLLRPVDSLSLVQGALSLWSYAPEIPGAPGRAGYFHQLVSDRRVRGPILTTQSQFDVAVGRWYPLAAGAARQVSYAPGELPRYGAVGTFGLRGLDSGVVDLEMLPADALYGFKPGTIYNIESSGIIREGGGFAGAHSDFARPEVAHAVWEMARVGGETSEPAGDSSA
jgi:hypothetical protein